MLGSPKYFQINTVFCHKLSNAIFWQQVQRNDSILALLDVFYFITVQLLFFSCHIPPFFCLFLPPILSVKQVKEFCSLSVKKKTPKKNQTFKPLRITCIVSFSSLMNESADSLLEVEFQFVTNHNYPFMWKSCFWKKKNFFFFAKIVNTVKNLTIYVGIVLVDVSSISYLYLNQEQFTICFKSFEFTNISNIMIY